MTRRLIPVLIAAALALGACSSVTPTPVPASDAPSASASAPSGSPSATPVTCDNATTSFAPNGPLPAPDALPAKLIFVVASGGRRQPTAR